VLAIVFGLVGLLDCQSVWDYVFFVLLVQALSAFGLAKLFNCDGVCIQKVFKSAVFCQSVTIGGVLGPFNDMMGKIFPM